VARLPCYRVRIQPHVTNKRQLKRVRACMPAMKGFAPIPSAMPSWPVSVWLREEAFRSRPVTCVAAKWLANH
jgi:hypothetical protein